ncbi:MAG: PTS sugar transporter subunit IIA [bacterium]
MEISQFLTPEHTQCCAPGVSKKRVLQYLAELLSDEGISSDDLYVQFIARERLGSTGIGEGIAIPHCRIAGCKKITGALLKLSESVDFESIDGKPVDLVFALVVPEEENDEHLQTLATIAELMQHEENQARLRTADSSDRLYREATLPAAA